MSDLLPPNATDAERALSIAVRPEIPVPLRTLWNPYQCPANVLPWLAWALSVDEWDATWPETTQRQTIAASISQHKIKGTVGAVKSALLRGLGRTVEINENTGVPYTFGIRVQLLAGESSGGAIGGELMGRARGIVARTKNARSELTDESYFTEAGTAAIYTGAAMLNGSEVEIKGDPAPLPLDAYKANLLGSYWTVRMHSDYTGPIAKVKRASDGAELDYYNLPELLDFIAGETSWFFLRIHPQSGTAPSLRSVDYGTFGEGKIDANGLPYVTAAGFSDSRFTASIQNVFLSEASIILANRFNSDIFQGSSAFIYALEDSLPGGGPVVGNAAGGISADWKNQVNTYTPAASGCVGGTFGAGNASVITESVIQTETVTGAAPVMARGLTINASDSWDTLPAGGFYGGAFWKKDLGTAAVQDAVTAVNEKLNF